MANTFFPKNTIFFFSPVFLLGGVILARLILLEWPQVLSLENEVLMPSLDLAPNSGTIGDNFHEVPNTIPYKYIDKWAHTGIEIEDKANCVGSYLDTLKLDG